MEFTNSVPFYFMLYYFINLKGGLLIRKGSKSLYDYCQENPDKLYLLEEWDYEKNKELGLTPNNTTFGSGKRAWWKCRKCGHVWETIIGNRTRGNNCPQCNTYGTSIPELAIFFYLSKIYPDTIHRHRIQNIEFDVFVPSLNLAIEYDGYYYHKDRLEKENQKDETCKNNNIDFIRIRSNKLESTFYAKNIFIKEKGYNDISKGIKELFCYLNIEYNFDINIDNDYQSIFNIYIREKKENSLVDKFPEIAAEWHPTKNGDLTPENFSIGSNIKAWWLCPVCGHEWKTSISHRSKGEKCPICANNISWPDNEVEILKQWYPIEGIKVRSRLPNRTDPAIMSKVKIMGLKKENPILPWTEEEIEILKKYYTSEGKKILPRLPNRNYDTIISKATSLRLSVAKRYDSFSDKEIDILIKYYPLEGVRVSERLPNRSKDAIRVKASKL